MRGRRLLEPVSSDRVRYATNIRFEADASPSANGQFLRAPTTARRRAASNSELFTGLTLSAYERKSAIGNLPFFNLGEKP
jgi:hypothetical protein